MRKFILIFTALLIWTYAFAGLVWKTRTIATPTIPEGLASQYKALESMPEEAKAQMGDVMKLMEAKPETTYQTTYMSEGMMKMVDGTGEITIVRADKEVIWHINPANKTYTEMTFEQMKALFQKSAGMMESLGAAKPEYTYTPTKETKTIKGYKCKKIILTMPMVGETEQWLTEQIDIAQYTSGFEKMADISKQLIGNYPGIKGFMILTKSKSMTSEVLDVTEKKLPKKEFALPSGLTKEVQTLE